MSEYIPYTDDQKHRANHTDLVSMLESMGHKLKREGSNYRWVSGHDSVMIKGCEWYQNSRQMGGKAIDFCKEFFDMDFQESMEFLLNGEQGMGFREANYSQKEYERQPFVLPAANPNMRRVFAYLTKERCIDPEIVSHFARAKTIYEDAEHHNAVFVGRDEKSEARFACKRGTLSFAQTSFRRDVAGSDKKYGFSHAGTGGKLLVFEAPIDMLSYISLYKNGSAGGNPIQSYNIGRELGAAARRWQQDSYIALGGVSDRALLQFLKGHENINEVCLCLDNDRAGLEAIQRIGKAVQDKGYEVSAYVSHYKDWNEQLCKQIRAAPEQTESPALTMK